MNRQIYKMTISDTADSITFYLLDVPIVKKNVEGTATNTTIDGNVFTDYMWLKDQWEQKWSIMCNPEWSKLDAIYKRQFSDADVPTLKVFYGDNIYTDGSAEGSSFQIINDSEVYEGEIRGFSLYGNTTQETIAGKNLLNTNALNHTLPYTYTSRGIIFTIGTDGSITLNGQNDGTNNSTLFLYNSTTPLTVVGGQYTGDINPSDGVYRATSFICYDGSSYRSFRQNAVLSLAAGNQQMYVQVARGETTQFSNYKIYPMLEAGTTKSPYEPYVGSADGNITPSPNPDYPQDVNVVSGAQEVKITGKNLIDVDNATWVSSNSTLTEDSGVFEMAAQSGKIARIVLPITKLVSGMTYVISLEVRATSVASSGANTHIRLRESVNGGTWLNDSIGITVSDVFSKKTITYTPTTITEPYLWFYLSPSASNKNNVDIFVKNIQLELGSTATAYEPYQGQSQEINLGKNIWGGFSSDYSQTDNGIHYDSYADGTILVGAGTATASSYNMGSTNAAQTGRLINLKSGYYALSGGTNQITLALVSSTGLRIASTSTSTGSVIKNLTTDTTVFIRAEVASGTTISSATLIKPQLELGSTATSYAPYKTPLELAKIGDYQDYIWNDEGTWKIHKAINKIVLNGTENWALGSMFYCTNAVSGKTAVIPATGGAIMSDYFTYSSGATNDPSIDIVNGNVLRIRDTSKATVSDLTTWLGTHPTAVYYALATPTDTEITDAELIGQLNALLAGSLYKGTNNIFLIPRAGADGTMKLDYRIDYEKETVVQDTMPVKLDLTDGGIINACLCRQNVQVIMRETVK